MKLSCVNDYNLVFYSEVDSTNDAAKRIIKASNNVSNQIIIARSQFAGRGQNNREWHSLPGNIHLSIVIKPDKPLSKLYQLVYLIGNILAETTEQVSSKKSKIQLKWPNDLIINDKKAGGILLETINKGNDSHAVIGIGINYVYGPKIDAKIPATSLFDEIDCHLAQEDFIEILLCKFNKEYKIWNNEQDDELAFHRIRKKWLGRAFKLSEEVEVFKNDKIYAKGLFLGVDHEGGFLLKADNEILNIRYGDIY